MIALLICWLVLLAVVVAIVVGRSRSAGALTLGYFLSLSLIHIPGVLAFLSRNFVVPGEDETRTGLQLTLLGMAALVAGALAARWWGRKRGATHTAVTPLVFERLGWNVVALGSITYFVLVPVSHVAPSLTSLLSSTATLLIVGFWLRLYAARAKPARDTIVTLFALPLLPLATLTAGGFIGFGINWVLSILSFQFVIARKRLLFYLAAPLVVFLGLSLFVSYMGERTGIRDVVWNEQASLSDRVAREAVIFTEFQFLDLEDRVQSEQLNERLNQNYLVGAGVERHESGLNQLQYGKTVPWWILIPRSVWVDKPGVGGGGGGIAGGAQLVSQFTGQTFASGTSVGVGQVLEFYMNFGVPGVVIGFLGLGFLLMRLDLGIMRALATGDVRGLMLRVMPGLTLLQPGGNLAEIIVGFVAALVAAFLLLQLPFLSRRHQPKEPAIAPRASLASFR
jgi:hypothetical protein